jgi:hypothetical protein
MSLPLNQFRILSSHYFSLLHKDVLRTKAAPNLDLDLYTKNLAALF